MDDPADTKFGALERDDELAELILRWQQRLLFWACNGLLTKAAQTALALPDHHPGLDAAVARIAAADFTELPAILSLDWDEMEGSACAYSPERQLILINREWLDTAVAEQVFAVLTEQLGHHFDVLLNPVDTPGDEGERFLECLRAGGSGEDTLTQFADEERHGVVHLHGETIAVEEAGVSAVCLDLRDLPHPSELPPS